MSDEVKAMNDDSYMVNLNDVPDDNLIPNGTYEGHISEVVFRHSQTSGAPMWNVKVQLDSGEHAGRYLRHIVMLAGPGLVMGKRSISQFAPELLEKEFDAMLIADNGDLEGRSVKVKVDTEIYKGEKQNRIKELSKSTDADNVGW